MAKATRDAPAERLAPAEIRILRSEASHGIALSGRTLIVLWQTETRTQAVHELAALLASQAAEFGNVGLLQVIGDQAISPDGAARTALAEMLKANEAGIVASAVAFEGVGFRASMVRSIVIGISMLSRPQCPHTVFASAEEAIAWLSARLDDGASNSAERMRRAVAQLRQRLDLAPAPTR